MVPGAIWRLKSSTCGMETLWRNFVVSAGIGAEPGCRKTKNRLKKQTFRSTRLAQDFCSNLLGPKPYTISINPKPYCPKQALNLEPGPLPTHTSVAVP